MATVCAKKVSFVVVTGDFLGQVVCENLNPRLDIVFNRVSGKTVY